MVTDDESTLNMNEENEKIKMFKTSVEKSKKTDNRKEKVNS
jgi:hypothetical protein